LSYRQVVEIIKNTATDLGSTSHDAETGAGLLNIAAAVHLAKATKPEVSEKNLQFIPLTWSGEGLVTPMERAADPDASSSGSSQVSKSFSPVGTFSDFLNVFGNAQSSGFTFFLKEVFDKFYIQDKHKNQGLVGHLLFQTHRALDNRIATRYSSDGKNWSAWKKENIPNEVTYYQPVVAKLNGVAYQSHVGKDKKIYTRSSTNGINWTAWKAANVSNEEAYGTPWLDALNGKLYQYHIGKDSYLYMRYSNDGENWNAWKKMGNARTHIPEQKSGDNDGDGQQPSNSWENPLDAGTYTIFPSSRYRTPQRPTHNGIDLSTWKSNPYVRVKAAKPGEVIQVGYHPDGWGTFIRIQHDDGLRTVYAHLSKTDVRKGDYVKGGQKIGNVGSTGNSTGPHLHFEVHVAPYRHPQDTRNPENYIRF